MDEQLKALLESINALKSGQEETKERMENMQEEIKNELKERIEKGQQEMQIGQEELRSTLEKKIDSVEEKIALKVEEKIAVVEEKIEKKVGEEIGRIKAQVEERIEGVAENFSLISQRVEDLEMKLLVCANKNKSNFLPSSPVPVLTSVACDFLNSVIETPKILQGLRAPANENKTPENRRKLASEVERLANLAFSDHPATVQEAISLRYFVDVLKDGEIQKAVRMADVQDLKSVLLYALKLEAATQASRRDHQSIQRARVTTDKPCESRSLKEMEKLKEEMQTIKAGISNQEKRNFKC
ncbi:uncharacterized protein TNCV_2308371 [Trichonephila clavipes]|nr:uncharacterized protein TNCV_2308371 [Trichonephila clavipes]